MISLPEAVAEGQWDIITLQQVSRESGKLEPYLTDLANAIRAAAPTAKLFIHETWAYDVNSTHPRFPEYNRDQEHMYNLVHRCYQDAAERISSPAARSFRPCGIR